MPVLALTMDKSPGLTLYSSIMASERVQRRIERLLDQLIERLLDQLDEAETQGNWESVRDLAQDVLEIDPDNTETGTYLRSSARRLGAVTATPSRSEEHTSELQSRTNLVCRLLLEKKKAYT